MLSVFSSPTSIFPRSKIFPQLDREREREWEKVSSMSVECSSEIIRSPLILSSSFSIKNNSVRGIFAGNHLENLSRDPAALIATLNILLLLFPFSSPTNFSPHPPRIGVRNLGNATDYPSPVLIYNARMYSRNAQGVAFALDTKADRGGLDFGWLQVDRREGREDGERTRQLITGGWQTEN